MSARIGLALFALVGGCLHAPPAHDEDSVFSPDTAPAAPSVAAPTPVPIPKASMPVADAKQATKCPVATGRRTFCEGRKVCKRDSNGCETCKCNTELDSSRARFEQTNPWDMRQR